MKYNFVVLLALATVLGASSACTEDPFESVRHPTNNPPEITHLSVGDPPFFKTSVLEAVAEVEDLDADEVSLKYSWYVNGVSLPTETGARLTGTQFSRGDRVYVRVTPNDGEEDGRPMSSIVSVIANSPPTLEAVSILKQPGERGYLFSAVAAGGADADGDEVSLAYQWYLNGEALTGATEPTLRRRRMPLSKGNILSVQLTPNDGQAEGIPILARIIIENTPPILDEVRLADDVPITKTSTLTLSHAWGGDADRDALTYTFDWYVNGLLVSTGPSLADAFARGDTVAVLVTAHDGEDPSMPMWSNALTVANTAPSMRRVMLDPLVGPYDQTTILQAFPYGEDIDGDTVTYSIVWYVDGLPVPGANDGELMPGNFSRGATVAALAAPHDGTLAGAPMWSDTISISNTPPILLSLTLEAGPYDAATPIKAVSYAIDLDYEPAARNYQWYVNGVPVVGQTSATLSPGFFARGNSVFVQVTPYDGQDYGEPLNSNAVTIVNTPPAMQSTSVAPGPYHKASTISANATASDADGDLVAFMYRWYVNEAEVTASTSATLAGPFSKGDSVYAVITPTDGIAMGSPATSNTVVIGNASPVMETAALAPGPYTKASTLSATATATDPDDDALTFAYQWHVNGSPLAGATSPTLAGSFGQTDVVSVAVVANDLESSSAPMMSNAIVIENSPPSITGATLGAGPFFETSTLTAVAWGWEDADSDPPGYQVQWYVNGIPASSSSSLMGAFFDHGDLISAIVTPDDGFDVGLGVLTPSVAISNILPTAPQIVLSPSTLVHSTALWVDFADLSADDDGDPISYRYEWFRNGVLQGYPSAQTIVTPAHIAGETWRVVVTPTDGYGDGATDAADAVVVNTLPDAPLLEPSPSSAIHGTDLWVNVTPSVDAEDDPVTYTYSWYKHSVLQAYPTDTTLVTPGKVPGETWRVVVTPNDGYGNGATSATQAVVVNAKPAAPTPLFSPSNSIHGTDLWVTATPNTDSDGDPVTYTYRWYKDDTLQAYPSNTTIVTPGKIPDETWRVEATPHDGYEDGATAQAQAVVVNSLPVITAASLGAGPFYETSTLNASVQGSSDADGDPIIYATEWYVNGAPVTTSTSLTGAYFNHGDLVMARLTPYDGYAQGDFSDTPTVVIANTLPGAAPVAELLSSSALTTTTADRLWVRIITPSPDADGDAITYAYRWYRNGATTSIATSVTAITAPDLDQGAWHVLVTPNDGYGDGPRGATAVKSAIRILSGLALGNAHTCANDSSGSVQCWGSNSLGQFGDGTTVSSTTATASTATAVREVSAGYAHTCGLTTGGGVKCWGYNGGGRLGNGNLTDSLVPVNVVGLTSGVDSISAGNTFTCALTTGGAAKCWGSNGYGQLGNGTIAGSTSPVDVTGLGSGVTQISAGASHACALLTDHTVKCWGRNNHGQLGDGSNDDRWTPVPVSGLTSVSAVASGAYHTCALTTGGAVHCWGGNGAGQLGDGTPTPSSLPVSVSGLTVGVSAITVGESHSCAQLGGTVKCWGSNASGQLGDGNMPTASSLPVAVSQLVSPVRKVFASSSSNHTCAIMTAGGIKCWGANTTGQVGDAAMANRATPQRVSGFSAVRALAGGYWYTCAVTLGGAAKCWGDNSGGQLGDGSYDRRLDPTPVYGLSSGVAGISTINGAATCAVLESGGVKCWGWNYWGQLGTGNKDSSLIPQTVAGLNATSVGSGERHMCALTSTGGVKCWGNNNWVALGDGTTTERLTPVSTQGVWSDIASITVGDRHSCALTVDGEVRCWGQNGEGQIGNNSTNTAWWPQNPAGLTSGVTAIAAGENHSCALTVGGGVKCWGSNGHGQLGNNSTTRSLTPVNVTGLSSGVLAITAGAAHTCAIVTGGALKCWGSNYSGAVGNNSMADSLVPADVVGLSSGVSLVVGGWNYTCAVAGSTEWCWGRRQEGEVGDGTVNSWPRYTPVRVVDLW